MALELQLIKHHSGILIPATPETRDILQSKTRLGDILVAEFRRVRNPAFHRRFFALLNLGFEYWEPTGGAISSNERKLITGYAKFLASYAGNEGALIDAAEQYLEQVAYREILRREKTCDLPVPADIAGGLLEYAHRLRSSAMHADTDGPDAADDRTAATSSITYCQAVLWIKPLLAVIEKGNNNFAGIRQIEQERR